MYEALTLATHNIRALLSYSKQLQLYFLDKLEIMIHILCSKILAYWILS